MQKKYSKNTVKNTVRIQYKYNKNTVKIQSKYSKNSTNADKVHGNRQAARGGTKSQYLTPKIDRHASHNTSTQNKKEEPQNQKSMSFETP